MHNQKAVRQTLEERRLEDVEIEKYKTWCLQAVESVLVI